MKLALTFVCLFSILCLHSRELYFRHIETDAGMNQTSAISIYQDKYDRIWFGNNMLNVYDGEKTHSYPLSSRLENIPDNNIHMICGDGDEYLFMIAHRNIIAYNYKYDTFYDTGFMGTALYYKDDYLYFGYDNRISRLNRAGEKEDICILSEERIYIQCLYPYKDGWLAGTNRGLYLYENEQVIHTHPEKIITTIFLDRNENIWLGTSTKGVFLQQKDHWENFNDRSSTYTLTNNQIRCINEDESGNIWIGTFAGITIIDPDSKDFHHIHPDVTSGWTLRHSSVYDIIKDHQGGMWIGTYYGGLSYFNPDTKRYYFYPADNKNPEKLNGFLFGNMTEDNKGNIYIATENGGLNRINKYTKKIDNFADVKQEVPFTTAKSVWYNEKEDLLYIGTFMKGLYTFSPKTNQFTPIGANILTSPQQRIISDMVEWQGNLLFVTQDGLYKLDLKTKKITPFFEQKDFHTETISVVRDIYLDRQKGILWMARAHKEIIYVDLNNKKIVFTPQLSEYVGHNPIESIDGDENGHLYMLVTGLGIVEYNQNNQQITTHDLETNQMISDPVFKAVVIRPQVLLLTSFKNISLLDLTNKTIRHTVLGEASPLHTLNQNCGVYQSLSSNEIFIGGIEGVLSVEEEGLITTESDYTFGFNSLYINNQLATPHEFPSLIPEAFPFLKSIQLPYNQNNISIEFFSTDYRHLNFNRYEYKLSGLDKQWNPTNHKQITYSSLHPGKYQLQIREIDSGKEISLGIRITPPFYLSAYAFGFYSILILLTLAWIIRFNRSRAVLKASLELEKREKQKLEELNQMKLRFYINISHELRTPLTLISNQLELILKNNGLPTPSLRKFTKIKQYTEQLNNLISEILDLRKLEQGKMPLHAQYINIVGFIKKIYESFMDYATFHNVNYKLDYMEEELYIWFDPTQMQKVFNNLLSNAFKFTDSGGSIIIRLEKDIDEVRIYIEDTGCGIPQEHQQQIFQRFYQVDTTPEQQQMGTGIGLALTKEIINQHAGSISVKSYPGQGTCFSVALQRGDSHLTTEQKITDRPSITPPATPVPVVEEQNEEVRNKEIHEETGKKKKTILIIEDNRELLGILSEAFTPIYNIYTAHNGEEGFQLAEQLIPDLIISDVMMPGKTGVEICKELKRKISTSHIPIILLSARTNQEQIVEALQYGAADYITKPFNLETLLLKCKNLLQYQSRIVQQYSSESEKEELSLATSRKDQELLDKSIRLIEENMNHKDFSIDKWCREVAIGRTSLGMKIKTLTGMTLNDFILHIKLKKCAELLGEAELSISEIAWQCGFSSPGYMGKCFKNQFGMTPLEYRNKKKKTNCSPT